MAFSQIDEDGNGLHLAGPVGLFGATPVEQQSTQGTVDGYASGGGGSPLNSDDTFTGDSGTAAYTIGDIVLALKNVGILAAS